FRLYGYDEVRVEVGDLRRPQSLGDRRDLTERQRARLAIGAGHDQRQLLEIGGSLPRFRRQTNCNVAHVVGRIDPVTCLDPGERRTQRLCNLTDGYAEPSGEAPIQI